MSDFAEAARQALESALEKGDEPVATAVGTPGTDSFFEVNARSGKARFVSPAFPDGKALTNAELLAFYNLDPADWDVASLRVSSGQFWFREYEGTEAVTRFGHRYSGEFVSKTSPLVKDRAPKWDPVRMATPVSINYTRPKPRASTNIKTAVIFPDPQIGFGRSSDGPLFTTHDPGAMDLALQLADYVQPDVIINLGDTLDSAEWGKYMSGPVFAGTTNMSLDVAHKFLAMQKQICDEVAVIDGNHDSARIEKQILANLAQAHGVRRAGTDEDPVLSLPFLLRVDDLGVDWYGSYPNGLYWLRDDICVHHGEKLSARDQAQKGRSITHTIQGHVHRVEMQSRSFTGLRGEILQTWHMSPGTLAKVTGEVPSFGSSLSIKGWPVRRAEDWQQGLMVLRYEDTPRGLIEPVMVQIEVDGSALYDGKIFSPGQFRKHFEPTA